MSMNAARLRSLILRIWAVLVAAWLILPIFVIIPLSFTAKKSFSYPPEEYSLRWYENFFKNADWSDALLNSLGVAFAVMVVATVAGTAAALVLRSRNTPTSMLIRAALVSPMIVPQILIAVAVFGVFIKWRLTGTTGGFILAHTVIALPLVLITVEASLRRLDGRLELAAQSLGATPMVSLFRVTLPLAAPGIFAGGVFAFVTSLDEVVIALYLQSTDLRTLPVQMFNSVTVDVDPTIAAASSLLLVVTSLVVAIPLLLRKDI